MDPILAENGIFRPRILIFCERADAQTDKTHRGCRSVTKHNDITNLVFCIPYRQNDWTNVWLVQIHVNVLYEN